MKIWTEAELEVLRQRYPYEKNSVLAADLGVKVRQLRAKAFLLKINKIDGEKYCNRTTKRWTEQEDELIKEWWPVVSSRQQPGKNAHWLANKIGCSVSQVRGRIIVLGLRKFKKKDPIWSDDEIELLDQFLHLNPKCIQTKLAKKGYHRSEAAIVLQRWRKLGGIANATGGYSANQLASFMGVSSTPVIHWIKKGWLKATFRGETVADHGGPGDRWIITPKDLRKFIFDNPALINSRGINFVWLIDLLRGDYS